LVSHHCCYLLAGLVPFFLCSKNLQIGGVSGTLGARIYPQTIRALSLLTQNRFGGRGPYSRLGSVPKWTTDRSQRPVRFCCNCESTPKRGRDSGRPSGNRPPAREAWRPFSP